MDLNHLMEMPEFRALLIDLERSGQKAELERIKADPLAHKTTRLWSEGRSPNYRYWGNLQNGKGQRIRFCWSTTRNAAGFFLGWRETLMKNGTGKRDMWVSRRVKSRVKEISKRRHDAMRARVNPALE